MAYFYVKAGGTRTTGGGDGTLRTGTWSANASDYYDTLTACLADGSSPPTAGDFILWSDASTDTYSSDVNNTLPAGVTLLTVSDSNQDRYSAASSALMTPIGSPHYAIEGTNSLGRNVLTMGVNIQIADSFSNAQSYGGTNSTHIMHDAKWEQLSTGNETHWVSGQYGAALLAHNTEFSNNPNDDWVLFNGYGGWGLFLGGSVSDTSDFLEVGIRTGAVMCVGTDMSGLAASPTVATVDSGNSIGWVYLYRCELPLNWTVSNFTQTSTSTIIVESCDSEYQYEQKGFFGDISFVTSRYHDDDPALSDGSSKGSYHFQPNTNVSTMGPLFLSNPTQPRWLMAENTDASAKPKVRLKFATATADTLDTASIWVYVMYPDSTKTYVWKSVRHQVSPIESGSALSTQSGKWVGPGTDNQYYLDVTMTSPGNGLVACMVGFTEDKDVYLSPVIEFVA